MYFGFTRTGFANEFLYNSCFRVLRLQALGRRFKVFEAADRVHVAGLAALERLGSFHAHRTHSARLRGCFDGLLAGRRAQRR